jgi:NAD-dependent SIR2 family protein deacetylase
MRRGSFVFTSNVDGQFQRAGFDAEQIVEVHGTVAGMQCTRGCGVGIFSAEPFQVEIDPSTMRAAFPLPSCPGCGELARPNILMFGDYGWDSSETDVQERAMASWLDSLGDARLVVVECGAGQAVPTVRITCQKIARSCPAKLIRINTREAEVPAGHVSLPMGALDALREIDLRLGSPVE